MKISSLFLYVVNFIFMAFGGAVIGLGAWGIKHKQNIKDAVPAHGMNIILAVGVFLIFVSLVGCVGTASRENGCGRCLLTGYAVFMFLILILDIAAAAIFFSVTGKLHNDKLNHDINKWITRTYAKCCDADTHEPIDRGCWLSGNHKVVNADTCQSEEAFHDELTHWLHDRLKPIAIVLAVIAAVQLISILVTFYLIRAGKKAQRKSEDRRAPYGVLSGGDHAHNPHAGMPVRYE